MLGRSWPRLKELFARERFERELTEELEVFLELETAERQRKGSSAWEARRAAHMEMGGLEQLKERLRDQHLGVWLESVGRDLQYGARSLARKPGFTIVAVLVLALGIGANAAIFSVVQSVLLAPLPFAQSDRLVRLLGTSTQANGQQVTGGLSPVYFHAVRDTSGLLERVAAQRYRNLTLAGDGAPERVVGIGVSDQWLETLGVLPMLGRGFDESEQKAGSDSRVVMLGHSFWQRHFGGKQDILGRTLRLDGESYQVIGVMPPSFRYPYDTDLWLPQTFSRSPKQPGDLNVVGRMEPGTTHLQLREEMGSIAEKLQAEAPVASNVGIEARPFRREFRRDPSRSITALLVAVGFVLLIACVNVANLILARGMARREEIAVRAALGARRLRLIRQLVTECVLLAMMGGLLGVVVAAWCSHSLRMLIPSRLGEVIQDIGMNGSVFAISFLLCLLAGGFSGLIPALRLAGRDPINTLKEGGRSGAGHAGYVFKAFVVTQVALAVVLLSGATLMARNFYRLLSTDVHYDPKNLLKIQLSLSQTSYEDPLRRAATIHLVEERVVTVPGVISAGLTSLQPIPRTTTNTGARLAVVDEPDSTRPLPLVNSRLVTPAYFRTMGIRIIRGRGFSTQDTPSSLPVLVVNESAARRFWPGQDPIGQRARPGPIDDETVRWHTVVGVVSDVVEPEDNIAETIYRAYEQGTASQPPGIWSTTSLSLMVRISDEPSDVLARIRDALREVDSSLPMYETATMEEALAEPLSDQRLGTLLFVGFSVFGLVMAVLGTSGVVAFSVSQRTREFGVRLALGAGPGGLQRMVIGEGMRLVAGGLVLGTAGAMGLSHWLASVLTEINPRDPMTLAGVAIILLLTGLLACWIPARRAAHVDPVAVLRYE